MKYLLLSIVLLLSFSCFSQSEIKGKISDASGTGVPGASVVLKNRESKIVTYTISDNDGNYSLAVSDNGDYTVEVNSLGFERQVLTVALTPGSPVNQNFTLKEGGIELKEVVIEAEAPVKRRGDTLVYDAKALSTGHEVVVEDLLKNIPGVTVQKDGKIFYGEQEIEKVMVDGDDLFNRGYSLLTKNMPTQPLDKIEVLQNYSNNKLLKGVEDSQRVALNLTVDQAYKQLWFGNITAGYGNDERYRVGGNLMNFGKNYKSFLTADFNNAGFDNIGDINAMFYNSNEMESVGAGSRAQQVMNLSFKTASLDEDRTRFNNAKMATLSTIMPLGTKAKLKLTGFAGFDKRSSFQDSFRVVNTDFASFVNTELNASENDIGKGYVNAFINYDLSATQMLQSSSTYNAGKSDFGNSLIFNSVSTKESLETNNTYFDQKLTYTHKWNERNVVLVKARFLTDRLPQEYAIDDYLLGDLFTGYGDINGIGNSVQTTKEYAALQADFKLKQKNNDLISFVVGFDNNNDRLDARFSLFTDGGTVAPPDFQANARYRVGDLYAQSGYTYKLNKFSVNATLNAHQLFNRFGSATGNSAEQNPFIINPFISAAWEIKPDNVLRASYSYNVINSDLLEVNDAYLLITSRSFSKGLGYFNQLENSSAALNFTTKHYLNRYSFSVGAEYSKQNDVVSYRSAIDSNSSLSEAFIMRGGDRLGARIAAHYVVRPLNGSVKLNARAERLVYYNQINDSGLRKNIYYGQTYELGWKSSFNWFFNFNIATEWNFSQVKSDNDFSNSNKYSFLDLMFKVTDNINITTKTEHYHFGGLDNYNNYFFADIEGSWAFAKDKYTIGLDARNLFNTDVFTTYSISDIGYSVNSYRLLPRYVLLSFKYRF
ncbi:MAG: carboxypeptidase regulatory-like domain-containing protein [Flavobacterium sp.]